jgi:hypothetical protein
MSDRPTPFGLVFDELSRTRFPALKASLAERQADPHDRDAFLLDPVGVQTLRAIVPEEGVGEAIDQHVAMLHNAYLFWQDGERTVTLDRPDAEQILTRPEPNGDLPSVTYYVQMPERLLWARVTEQQPHEPLDGLFVHRDGGGTLHVLAVFGLHPERLGFSVVEAAGIRPQNLVREDGTPLFSSVIEGGDRAGLYSITGGEELLELGARALSAADGTGPGS